MKNATTSYPVLAGLRGSAGDPLPGVRLLTQRAQGIRVVTTVGFYR